MRFVSCPDQSPLAVALLAMTRPGTERSVASRGDRPPSVMRTAQSQSSVTRSSCGGDFNTDIRRDRDDIVVDDVPVA